MGNDSRPADYHTDIESSAEAEKLSWARKVAQQQHVMLHLCGLALDVRPAVEKLVLPVEEVKSCGSDSGSVETATQA